MQPGKLIGLPLDDAKKVLVLAGWEAVITETAPVRSKGTPGSKRVLSAREVNDGSKTVMLICAAEYNT